MEVKLHPGDALSAHSFKVIAFTLIYKRAGFLHKPFLFWAPVAVLEGLIAAVPGELSSFFVAVSDLVVCQ